MDGEHPQLVPWAGLGVAAVAVLSPALGWSQGCRGHSPMALRCPWGWCCSIQSLLGGGDSIQPSLGLCIPARISASLSEFSKVEIPSDES